MANFSLMRSIYIRKSFIKREADGFPNGIEHDNIHKRCALIYNRISHAGSSEISPQRNFLHCECVPFSAIKRDAVFRVPYQPIDGYQLNASKKAANVHRARSRSACSRSRSSAIRPHTRSRHFVTFPSTITIFTIFFLR